MRKFLFMCLGLFGFINLFSQNVFNKAYHDKSEKANPFLTMINEDYYFTANNGDAGLNYGKCFLYKHDKNGNLKFRQQILNIDSKVPFINDSFKSLDNKLILIGNRTGCDYSDASSKSFITKIDTNGNSIFYFVFNFGVKTGLQHTDSSYYAFTDSLMFHFSKTGQFLTKKNLGINNISAAQLLQNGNFVLSASQGSSNYLLQVNSTGSIVVQTPISRVFFKLEFYGGQKLLGIDQGNKLCKISTNFSIIDSNSFANGAAIKDFIVQNDTIYSINFSGATQTYRVSDTLLSSIFQSTTNTQRTSQLSICKKDNFVGILSICLSSWAFNANNAFSSINVIRKSGSNNYFENVKFLSVTADSIYISSTIIATQNYTTTLYYTNLRANVWIKNIGNNVLDNIKLNYFILQALACGSDHYQKYFSGLSLNPGDSIKLTTDFIQKNVSSAIQTSSIISQYCFYSTLPNKGNDKDISNDGLCTNIIFNPISIKENEKNPINFKLFPNPLQNKFWLECEIEIKKVELFNALGMLVKKIILNETYFSVDCSDLNNGIYFIKIETEEGFAIKKIVKE